MPSRRAGRRSDRATASLARDRRPRQIGDRMRSRQDLLEPGAPLRVSSSSNATRRPSAAQDQVGVVQPLRDPAPNAAEPDRERLGLPLPGAVERAEPPFADDLPERSEHPAAGGQPQPGDADVVLVGAQVGPRRGKPAADRGHARARDPVPARLARERRVAAHVAGVCGLREPRRGGRARGPSSSATWSASTKRCSAQKERSSASRSVRPVTPTWPRASSGRRFSPRHGGGGEAAHARPQETTAIPPGLTVNAAWSTSPR